MMGCPRGRVAGTEIFRLEQNWEVRERWAGMPALITDRFSVEWRSSLELLLRAARANVGQVLGARFQPWSSPGGRGPATEGLHHEARLAQSTSGHLESEIPQGTHLGCPP